MKKLLLLVLLALSQVAASQSVTGTVMGRILTADGSPAAGVRVSAVAVPVSHVLGTDLLLLSGIAVTDIMGRYQLEDLPSGRYLIAAGLLDSLTYYPGTASASAAKEVVVSAATPARNIDFSIVLPVMVTIKEFLIVEWNAVVEGGGPVPRMTMSLIPFDGDLVERSFTLQGRGHFRHTVPEGDYRVAWSGLPAGFRVKSVTSGLTDVLANPVKVAGTDDTSILITLEASSPPPWVKVRGRVTGAVARVPSIESLRVTLSGQMTARPIPDAPVNADGSFEFPMVLPGRYVVNVNAGTDGEAYATADGLFIPIAVSVSSDVADLEIPIPRTKTIPVRVTVKDNAAGPSAITFRFMRIQGGPEMRATAQRKPDGTFTVDAPEGEVWISLSPILDFQLREIKYKSLTFPGNSVMVDPDNTKADEAIVLTLERFVPTSRESTPIFR